MIDYCIKNLHLKKKRELELLIQMCKKILLKNSIYHCISQFLVFKIFQNCLPLCQWHHTTFHVK
jgi:hypothetical protein